MNGGGNSGGVFNPSNLMLFSYTHNNPVNLVDPDGNEPVIKYAGTIEGFVKVMDNSRRAVGKFTGNKADAYLLSLSNTKNMLPTQTGYYNLKKGRYIYTKNAGWVDMVHFLFYAGKARKYKNDHSIADAIGLAMSDGYMQEKMDIYLAPHSAFSYEDLPSDKVGALFGAYVFDKNSKKTLSEQLEVFFKDYLKATSPNKAPNYNQIPKTDEKVHANGRPTKQNGSYKPCYVK